MLSALIQDVGDELTGRIEPGKVASLLHLSLGDLADLCRVHRNTLARSPQNPQLQANLGKLIQILVTASSLMADGKARGSVVLWFNNQPLSGFGGKTARDLVREGHGDAVIEHLAMLADGVGA